VVIMAIGISVTTMIVITEMIISVAIGMATIERF
jgi:hypothetical protein